MTEFLHERRDFGQLIAIVAEQRGIEPALAGIKQGILLELGFDDTAPNRPVTMSSWAYDVAAEDGIPYNLAFDESIWSP